MFDPAKPMNEIYRDAGMSRAYEERKEGEPIFAVIRRTDGAMFRVWANGRVEGFGDDLLILNNMAPLDDDAMNRAGGPRPKRSLTFSRVKS